jgi:hypothetical protein
MRRHFPAIALLSAALLSLFSAPALAQGDPSKPGRAPGQAIDEEYTKKILEYTTEKFFLSPLVDYLPASKSVPTPKAVLGDIAGASALRGLSGRNCCRAFPRPMFLPLNPRKAKPLFNIS